MLNKLYIVITICLLASVYGRSQDTATIAPHSFQPHRQLPLPLVPQFAGGKDSLAAFLKHNTHYPAAARKHNISGTIEVDFMVDTLGHLSDFKVLKSLGYGCDKEALRVAKKMPTWKPGMQGRRPIALDYHIDIIFAAPK